MLGAVLAGGDGVAVSHGTAGRLRALKHVEDLGLEIVAPLGRHKRLEGVVGHRSGALFESDLTVYRSIPTTTVARTLIDVSSRLTDRRLGDAVDDALRRRILRLDDLRRTAGRLGSRPWSLDATRSIRSWRLRVPGYDPLDSEPRDPSPPGVRRRRPARSRGNSIPITLDGVPCHLDLAYPDARRLHRARRVGVAPHPIGVR